MPAVLYVDDDPLSLEVVRDILGCFGVEVRCTQSPHEALALAVVGDVDAVITDLDMPGMNGTQLASRIKAECGPLPVIAYTGSPNAFPLEPFDRVVVKATGFDDLVEAVCGQMRLPVPTH
jgi:CheY-like chemotaxis protein